MAVMADARPEPSMEEILASIKRIIADDGAAVAPRPRRVAAEASAPPPDAPVPPVVEPPVDAPAALVFAGAAADPAPADILELTEPAPPLVSPDAAVASKQSLDLLSSLVTRGGGTSETSLEGMVRELLRPMLKEWLDAHLPELVENLVAREIARITGKAV